MKCEQEFCPFWSGVGCVCDVFDIGTDVRRLARDDSRIAAGEPCPSGWCGPWLNGACVDCGTSRNRG